MCVIAIAIAEINYTVNFGGFFFKYFEVTSIDIFEKKIREQENNNELATVVVGVGGSSARTATRRPLCRHRSAAWGLLGPLQLFSKQRAVGAFLSLLSLSLSFYRAGCLLLISLATQFVVFCLCFSLSLYVKTVPRFDFNATRDFVVDRSRTPVCCLAIAFPLTYINLNKNVLLIALTPIA